MPLQHTLTKKTANFKTSQVKRAVVHKGPLIMFHVSLAGSCRGVTGSTSDFQILHSLFGYIVRARMRIWLGTGNGIGLLQKGCMTDKQVNSHGAQVGGQQIKLNLIQARKQREASPGYCLQSM